MTDRPSYNVRAIALDAIMLICDEGKYTHLVINSVMDKYAYIPKQDRALLSRLIRGTIEYRLQIDYVIGIYSSVKLAKLKPSVRGILRLSIYQILHMDRIPDRAICDEAVKLTCARGLIGLKGFVNGVLRKICREKDNIQFDTLSTKYSMPEWIVELFIRQYGEERTESILSAMMERRPLCVRINQSLITPDEAIAEIKKQDIEVTPAVGLDDVLFLDGIESISKLKAWQSGHVSIQDISSTFVCRCAGMRPGDSVLDLCSAPGGKTMHAADILSGKGMITACDISKQKIDLISDSIKKAHFDNIELEVSDATEYRSEWHNKYDIVLADLPCSGLGIMGSKPDIRYNASLESCDSLVDLQRTILDQAVRYIKPGGRLVYSTCTLNYAENEGNRKYVLDNNADMSPVDISEYIPEDYRAGTESDGYITLLPDLNESDGFFVSVYKKDM